MKKFSGKNHSITVFGEMNVDIHNGNVYNYKEDYNITLSSKLLDIMLKFEWNLPKQDYRFFLMNRYNNNRGRRI